MAEYSQRSDDDGRAFEPAERLPPGVTLTRSPLGGYTVQEGGRLLGWIHQGGDGWNAYRRGAGGGPGIRLGRFPRDEAIRRIANAAE